MIKEDFLIKDFKNDDERMEVLKIIKEKTSLKRWGDRDDFVCIFRSKEDCDDEFFCLHGIPFGYRCVSLSNYTPREFIDKYGYDHYVNVPKGRLTELKLDLDMESLASSCQEYNNSIMNIMADNMRLSAKPMCQISNEKFNNLYKEKNMAPYGTSITGYSTQMNYPATSPINKQPKEKTMTLQKLSNTFKRVWPGDMKTQYIAGFRDSSLELTPRGKEHLLDLLATKFEKELTVEAKTFIKDVRKEDNSVCCED